MEEIDYIPTKEEEERINTLFSYRPDGKLYKEAKQFLQNCDLPTDSSDILTDDQAV